LLIDDILMTKMLFTLSGKKFWRMVFGATKKNALEHVFVARE